MKLENYTYHQSNFVRYLAILYTLIFLGLCIYFYVIEIENMFILYLNLPIALLIFASFSKKTYFAIQDNQFAVYNSFKARQFELDSIDKIKNRGKNWTVYLSNKQLVNLTDLRVAKADKAHFQKQMKNLQTYLKNKEKN